MKNLISSVISYCGLKIIKHGRKWGLIPNFPLVSDRAIEYHFACRELNRINAKKVLDVGFCESVFPFVLSGLGYDIHAIDIRDFPLKKSIFKTYKGDIRKTDFKANSFDAVTALSTVEHLGIPTRYKSYNDPNADRKAIIEMLRILKKGGSLIITMPFGKYNVDDVQRTYDKKHIDLLLKGLKVRKIKYSIKNNQFWDYSSYDSVKNIKGYNSNILISIIK